jgi:glycine dehydrogenase
MAMQTPAASAPHDLLTPLDTLENNGEFIDRHIGPDAEQIKQMLSALHLDSLEGLVDETVPAAIALQEPMALGTAMTEPQALAALRSLADKNELRKSFIGLGYYDTHTPNVILRNVLENPSWYTAYTPYQPEISQGRLESLLNYQQMVLDLTGMDLANASLLDEATAAAEAMALAKRVSKNRKANAFFVDAQCFPQTIDVIKTRAECFDFELIIAEPSEIGASIDPATLFGGLFQYPAMNGELRDLSGFIATLHEHSAIAIAAADILSLTLLTPPGEMGADVVVGTTQRFGVPMGYGGPHAAYFATKDDYKRAVPGRIIGVSVDKRGRQAFRMALQTREQHIRREKANSNICTAQVLLANISAMYAMYHGPEGLRSIAQRVNRLAQIFSQGLKSERIEVVNTYLFDTVTVAVSGEQASSIVARADAAGINLRLDRLESDGEIGVSFDECTTAADVDTLWQVFVGDMAKEELSVAAIDAAIVAGKLELSIPDSLQRQSSYLTHPNFNLYHSETEMMRYLKSLEDKDISLTHSMIPLGSCTMKLNAAAEMMPISWPAFAKPHPFTPVAQMSGYIEMITQLETMLEAVTGFDAVSMQPNSGAQGEYAGLLAIRKYHLSRGDTQRTICLIPTSAHGTNPASAQMIGMKVVLVGCDDDGNIDIADLQAKAEAHSDTLAALMITYPSTHGVYEEGVKQACQIVHDNGGQVYMDGANLNAQVGVAKPAEIGADVSHMNLHKTFCIPHGGGGPGMGPIGVGAHLAPHVSNHSLIKLDGPDTNNGAVSAAPWGSSSILPISWMYIAMMGAEGLTKATQVAILGANYIAKRLEGPLSGAVHRSQRPSRPRVHHRPASA